jgi:hypothetical protein
VAEEVEEVEEEVEEVEEVVEEVAEVAEKEDKQTPQPHPASDSAETPQKYLQKTEKRRTASSPNSNDTT